MGSGSRAVTSLALAAICGAATLFLVDRVVARLDLGYTAARSVPNDERRLVRPEFSVDVKTNALGFREPRLPGPKPADTLRIVALGDSFTQGYGVEEAQAYPRRLESLMAARQPGRHVEVVNLGVPGTSPRDYLGTLRDPGLAYAPDVVLVGVMANDVQDVLLQRRFGVQFAAGVLREVQRDVAAPRPAWRTLPARLWPALYPLAWTRTHALWERLHPPTASAADTTPTPHAVGAPRVPPERWRDVLLALGERYGRRAETQAAAARLSATDADVIRPVLTGEESLDSGDGSDAYLHVLALIEPRLFADAVLLPPEYDDAWRATAATLHAIVRTAERAGARTVLVYIPAAHQVTDAARGPLEAYGFAWDPHTLTDTTMSDRLHAVADAEGVPLVDLLPVMRAAAGRALYFPGDGHWTPAGHALAAATIADALERP